MNNKINLYVCDNFYQEFDLVCQRKGYSDVVVIPFPSMCINKNKKAVTTKLLSENTVNGSEGMVFCGKNCEICSLATGSNLKVLTANDCFSHLASDSFIQYILAKGGYIISLGWLKNWRERISSAGFDQETARQFYHDFCRELVFFDAGIDANAANDLYELSQYLDLPHTTVPIDLDYLGMMLESIVTEHRFNRMKAQNNMELSEMEAQCAEYAAIFDLMGKIAAFSNKRDAIEKVKEIFLMVFGAQKFKYWNNEYENDSLPDDVKELLQSPERDYFFHKEENRFCIKVKRQENLFGAIDVSGFLFPQYTEKYINLSIDIVKICGLVFSNNAQYDVILKSEQEQRYSSTHDVLTGLYNRMYINVILQQSFNNPCTVFMFDIDRLKYVNDHYGHAEGDKLIVHVAELLKQCFRESDILARYGGDEFVAILIGVNEDTAEITENRIRQQIDTHNSKLRETHLAISFSIGYAVATQPEDTIVTILNKADERMYADKLLRRK